MKKLITITAERGINARQKNPIHIPNHLHTPPESTCVSRGTGGGARVGLSLGSPYSAPGNGTGRP